MDAPLKRAHSNPYAATSVSSTTVANTLTAPRSASFKRHRCRTWRTMSIRLFGELEDCLSMMPLCNPVVPVPGSAFWVRVSGSGSVPEGQYLRVLPFYIFDKRFDRSVSAPRTRIATHKRYHQ